MQWALALAVVVVCVLLDSLASDMVQRYATYVFINPVKEHTLSLYHHAVLLAYRVFFLFGGSC